jgi:hypothetical protein
MKEKVKAALGYDLGEIVYGERTTPGGKTLVWKATTPNPVCGHIISSYAPHFNCITDLIFNRTMEE